MINHTINYYNNNDLSTISKDFVLFSNPFSPILFGDEYYQRLHEIYNTQQSQNSVNKNKDHFNMVMTQWILVIHMKVTMI